jgi:hypothetical protein
MSRLAKLGLVVGYLSIAGAAAAAHLSPSAGYELSIYTATPLTFWAPVALALALAIVVAYRTDGITRSVALVLGVASFYAIAILPLLRGYYFYGPADSMTHLGWTKDIVTGRMYVLDLFYPGLHTTTIFTSGASSLALRHAMLLVVSLFILVFVAFTFLTVRAVATRYVDVVTAVFVALLILPLNHVTTHYMAPHPITDSIMLIPFGLFLLARYVTRIERGNQSMSRSERRRRVTQIGVMFAIYSGATVLYHSMQALHLLILLGGVVLVQLYFRTRTSWFDAASASFSRITRHRPVYLQTAFLGGLFAVWNLNHEPVRRSAGGWIQNLLSVLTGSGQAAEVVQSRTGSLAAIGVSPLEMLAKLFLPSLLFCGLVGVLMLGVLRGRLDDRTSDADAFVTYLCVALVGLIAFDLALLVAGSTSKLFFRTLGAVMAVVTVLSVFAIPRVLDWLPRRPSPSARQIGAMVAVGLLLVATVPILYPSPYIYKQNRMVDEQQMTGHANVFEHQVEGVEVTSVRIAPWRTYHALYGVETTGEVVNEMDEEENVVPFLQLGSLQSVFAADHYVTISEKDRLREAGVFRELRYTETGFASLNWQSDVHRVTSNGELQTYYVDKGGASA